MRNPERDPAALLRDPLQGESKSSNPDKSLRDLPDVDRGASQSSRWHGHHQSPNGLSTWHK
eukprot:12924357-Prorocentrum_lima.AAC.1